MKIDDKKSYRLGIYFNVDGIWSVQIDNAMILEDKNAITIF